MTFETMITIGAICGAFIAGIIVTIIKKLKFSSKRKRKLDPLDTLSRDLQIQDKLAELRVNLSAERVYICKFHNGEEYFDGNTIKKVSRTHETCKQGVSHEYLNFQSIPTTLVPSTMEMLYLSTHDNKPIVKYTRDISSGFLKNHLESTGIKTICKCKLMAYNRLIGYLGVHWDVEDCQIDVLKLQQIQQVSGLIENILTLTINITTNK